jgi:hypothetical protein
LRRCKLLIKDFLYLKKGDIDATLEYAVGHVTSRDPAEKVKFLRN